MKLEFSVPVFEKYSNIRFHENASSDSQVVPCRQVDTLMDRHDKANSCFLEFSEHT